MLRTFDLGRSQFVSRNTQLCLIVDVSVALLFPKEIENLSLSARQISEAEILYVTKSNQLKLDLAIHAPLLESEDISSWDYCLGSLPNAKVSGSACSFSFSIPFFRLVKRKEKLIVVSG